LIVDSSDNDQTKLLVLSNPLKNLEYIQSRKGLTIQRNAGMSLVNEEIVHFLDDDVEVEPDYFYELNKAFYENADLVGAGGMVLGGSNPKATWLGRISGRESTTPGVVLRSGYNIGAHEYPEIVQMDWLPGCSMSFRMSKINGLSFDESRAGYAMGEDVDFGLLARERGMILHIPTARLIHHLSPSNRERQTEMLKLATMHRWRLALDKRGKVNKFAVLTTTYIEALSYFAKGILDRDQTFREYSKACFSGIHEARRTMN
jgi:GT2 family glycosyltransferase